MLELKKMLHKNPNFSTQFIVCFQQH